MSDEKGAMRDTGRVDQRHDHGNGHDLDHGNGHDHDHGNGHDHDHGNGLIAALTHFFKPHSHDASDSIDSALESSRRGMRALLLSFGILMVTALIQLGLVVVTDSVSLLADTIHNFSDALTAIPLFIAFRLGRRLPTARYTFGYRKAEDIAGLFILLVILASAVVAFYESWTRLFDPVPLRNLWILLAAGVLGFIGNEAVAIYRVRVGRQIGSAALVADGYHARADGFTSLGVVAGAIGALLGAPIVDALVGLVISIAIGAILIKASQQVFYRLMDAVDPTITESVDEVALGVDGVLDVGSVHIRWLGHRLSALVAIQVDQEFSVAEAHAVAEAVRHRLIHEIDSMEFVTVHVDPHGFTEDDDPHAELAHHPDPLAPGGKATSSDG